MDSTPFEFLEHAEAELMAMEHDDAATGVERREFVFRSLVAAAASTLGVRSVSYTHLTLPTNREV